MPWKVANVMEEKIRFVVRACAHDRKMSELCREFGISRRTGYYWLNRYQQEGTVTALQERSRRPHHSPNRTAEEVEARVVQLRKLYGWGGKKLQVLLAQEGIPLSVPTVNRIIHRQGLVKERNAHRPALQRFERSAPNELWQMDFKGPFRFQQGTCHPLSILDDHSRFVLGLYALRNLQGDSVHSSIGRTFHQYGVPRALLIDHGTPWWSTSNGWGLTRLSVSFIQLGIDLIYSGVAHPQTQGKVERFHRTLSEAMYHRGRPQRWSQWKRFLQDFRHEYNYLRPHESLQMAVPASRYRPSRRSFSPRPSLWEYPTDLQVKRLNTQGCLYVAGRYYFVCEALAEKQVGIESLDGKLLVRYRQMYIREINLRTRQTRALVCRVQT